MAGVNVMSQDLEHYDGRHLEDLLPRAHPSLDINRVHLVRPIKTMYNRRPEARHHLEATLRHFVCLINQYPIHALG